MSLDEAPLVPLAKSPLSMSATRQRRRAASRATPAPVMPPPRMSRSNVSSVSAAGVRGHMLLPALPLPQSVQRLGALGRDLADVERFQAQLDGLIRLPLQALGHLEDDDDLAIGQAVEVHLELRVLLLGRLVVGVGADVLHEVD